MVISPLPTPLYGETSGPVVLLDAKFFLGSPNSGAKLMAPLLYSKPGEQSLTWPTPQSLFVSSTSPLQRWVLNWQEGVASSHFTFLNGYLLSSLLACSCWLVISGSSVLCWVPLWVELFCFCFRDLWIFLSSRPVIKVVARIWPCSLSNLHKCSNYCAISNSTVQTFLSAKMLCQTWENNDNFAEADMPPKNVDLKK